MNAMENSVYRRLVLDLHESAADERIMRIAAELAGLLRLDLQCLFVEDPALLALAHLPHTRELRLPGHAWENLDAERIAAEIQQAAARARRLLEEASAATGVTCVFEMRRGDPAAVMAALCEPTDIVVVAEPSRPSERVTGSFARRREAAYRSASAVLLIPPGTLRARGPVVAVVPAMPDASVATAARIARLADENLLLVVPAGAAEAAIGAAQATGLERARIGTRKPAGRTQAAIARELARLDPRLVVVARGSLTPDGEAGLSRLAGACGVPVLAVENQP
jgi:hypothetical protein